MTRRSILMLVIGLAAGAILVLGLQRLLPLGKTPDAAEDAQYSPPVPHGEQLSFDEEKNDFILFLHHFSTDTSYQFDHIHWPLMKLGLNSDFDIETTYVERGSWRFSDVAYCRNYMPLIHTSFSRTYPNTGERIISWYGKETGENYSYFFKRVELNWYLVRYEDFSG